MPKFVQDLIDNLDIDSDIEHLLCMNVAFEEPEFLEEEPEKYFPDAFVFDNIETM